MIPSVRYNPALLAAENTSHTLCTHASKVFLFRHPLYPWLQDSYNVPTTAACLATLATPTAALSRSLPHHSRASRRAPLACPHVAHMRVRRSHLRGLSLLRTLRRWRLRAIARHQRARQALPALAVTHL